MTIEAQVRSEIEQILISHLNGLICQVVYEISSIFVVLYESQYQVNKTLLSVILSGFLLLV